MAEIRVGQRYRLYPGRSGGFIAEVIRVVDARRAELKVLQDLGYGCELGRVWPHEPVLDGNYELMLGQEAPTS